MRHRTITSLLIPLALTTALTGCIADDDGTPLRPAAADDTPTSCTGTPGTPVGSDSYRPGAPDIADDGDELTVVVTVRVRTDDGTCRVGTNALVEIWHTGSTGSYLDDAWRTARRTGPDGTTSYRTDRPVGEENFPHLHVRVTSRNGSAQDWVVGIGPDTPDELRLDLLLESASPVTTQPADIPRV